MEQSKRRGPAPSEEKREAFMQAALMLFARQGVDATTTRDVASAANSTERTLFKHFGSKQGLVQAVVAKAVVELVRDAAFARILDPAPMTGNQLQDWHRLFLSERAAAAEAHPDKYRVLLAELLRDPVFRARLVSTWSGEVFAPFTARLAAMQAAGILASRQPATALAAAFFSLNLSYLVSRFMLAPDAAWSTGRDVDTVVALFAAICRD